MSEEPNPYSAPSTPPAARPLGSDKLVDSAPCPACGNMTASKVNFTWWGGALGPKLLHHVRCAGCGVRYNGRSGKYNTRGIVLYQIVGLVIVIPLWILWYRWLR